MDAQGRFAGTYSWNGKNKQFTWGFTKAPVLVANCSLIDANAANAAWNGIPSLSVPMPGSPVRPQIAITQPDGTTVAATIDELGVTDAGNPYVRYRYYLSGQRLVLGFAIFAVFPNDFCNYHGNWSENIHASDNSSYTSRSGSILLNYDPTSGFVTGDWWLAATPTATMDFAFTGRSSAWTDPAPSTGGFKLWVPVVRR